MALPTYYNTGTATVANGATLITFTDAFLGSEEFPTIMPGDLFMDPAQPEIPPQRIASVDYEANPQTATLAFNWPGTGLTADPYEIRLVGAIERSTAQTRRYLELLGQLGFTGIAINAFGDFADRTLYDAQPQGYTFLSMDGDGTPGSPPLIYIKQSSAEADWSAGISFQGPQGPAGADGTDGENAILGIWQGEWATATAYAVNDGFTHEGSAYIVLVAHTSGDFATDLGAGKFELAVSKGDTGPAGTAVDRSYEKYAANSGTVYTLPVAPSSDTGLDVYVGGILQPKDGLAYTYAGTTLTLSEDPGPDDIVEVYVFESLPMASVPAGSVGSAELNAVQAAAMRTVLNVPSVGDIREKLTANRTYYVRTDGSDSNNGLANTAGGAFLTIQKAIDVVASLDSSIFDITIQLAAGTYNIVAPGLVAKQVAGAGKVIIVGDETTPSNVVIAISGVVTGNDAVFKSSGVKTVYSLRGFKITATATGTLFGIVASSTSVVEFQNIDFGSLLTGTNSQQIRVEDNAIVLATGNYTISGGAAWHWNAVGGAVVRVQSKTITLTGTPNFTTAFLEAARGAIAFVNVNTFVGSATGVRYAVFDGAVVTAGSETYLPGNAAGTKSSGGIYNALVGGVRELLTANRTYYVRADGSDSNDGLTNTAGGAFLTIQKAINVVAALDRSTFFVSISVGAGTFSVSQNNINGWGPGSEIVSIVGAGATTIISASGNCFYIRNAQVLLQNMKFTSSGLSAIRAEAGAIVSHSGCDFGACVQPHIWLEQFSRAVCTGNYTISGSAPAHVFTRYSGSSYECYSKTITLSGTPAFSSAFVSATMHGNIVHGACTFSGSATGKRYSADTGGIIDSGGGGANYFPGNVAGTGTNLGTSPYGAYV